MLLRINPFKTAAPSRLLKNSVYRIGDDSDSDFKKIKKATSTGDQIDEKNVLSVIDKWVHSNDMCLFIKGTPMRPQCGFSGQVIRILNSLGANKYFSYNILENELVREQLKVYSKWPTFPQVYVKGQLVGGCDIVKEMYSDGSLKKLLTDSKLI